MEEATLGANRSGEKSGVFPPSSLVVHLEAPPQPPLFGAFRFFGFLPGRLEEVPAQRGGHRSSGVQLRGACAVCQGRQGAGFVGPVGLTLQGGAGWG